MPHGVPDASIRCFTFSELLRKVRRLCLWGKAAITGSDTMLRLEGPSASEKPFRDRQRPLDLEQVSAHLSNERTFLAWVWTGMMLMGFGVGIAKMRTASVDFSQSMGAGLQSSGAREIGPISMGELFIVLGLITIVMSACRYFTVQSQLRKQQYQPSNAVVYLLFIGLIALGGTLIVYVLQLR